MSGQQLLKGKWVLVTGASKGLGANIAMTMAKQGGSIALMARSEDKLQDVCLLSQTTLAVCFHELDWLYSEGHTTRRRASPCHTLHCIHARIKVHACMHAYRPLLYHLKHLLAVDQSLCANQWSSRPNRCQAEVLSFTRH